MARGRSFTNGHGDVVQLSNSSGVVVKNYDFSSFGVERDPDPADANPFRYCGEYFDKETGTVYLRARYYQPLSGRFLTEDPIKDGLSWYIYAGDNPIFYLDPFGLAMVPLRSWFSEQTNYNIDMYGGSGFLDWNGTTRIATISMNANGYSGYAEFTPGVAKTYIAPKTNLMWVDDTILWAVFGYVIDPPLIRSNPSDIVKSGLIMGETSSVAVPGSGNAAAAVIVAGAVGFAFGSHISEAIENAITYAKAISPYPPAKRDHSTTKKDAYEKAKQAGNGNEPIHHPNEEQDPHYHPDVQMPKNTTPHSPSPHDHYYYPKGR